MKRICLITCYMGPLPNYFPYFLATCKRNGWIDFVVINDTLHESFTDENVRFVKMSLTGLNEWSSRKLGQTIRLANSWKINELKPLFGVLFTEYTEGYEFWGWCDLDIIWGAIDEYITSEVLEKYDVITSKQHWTTGHFTVLRNTPYLNRLYEVNSDVYALLNREQYVAFEECCHRWEGKFYSLKELEDNRLPISFYDIVKNVEKEGSLKAYFNDLVREFPAVPINYVYRDRVFTDLNTGQQFMYYHLLAVKKLWRFYIPTYRNMPDSLLINGYGIRSLTEPLLVWKCRRAASCVKGMLKSIKKQEKKTILKKISRRISRGGEAVARPSALD